MLEKRKGVETSAKFLKSGRELSSLELNRGRILATSRIETIYPLFIQIICELKIISLQHRYLSFHLLILVINTRWFEILILYLILFPELIKTSHKFKCLSLGNFRFLPLLYLKRIFSTFLFYSVIWQHK